MPNSESRPQSAYAPFTQALVDWIKINTMEACTIDSENPNPHKGFVPRSLVEIHLQEQNFTRTRQLLAEVFRPHQSPVRCRDVAETCPRIICILLLLRKAHHVQAFVQNQLTDDRLPFESSLPPRHFPSDLSDPEFFNEFCKRQWQFCAQVFQPRSGLRIDEERILPFTKLIPRGGGASAHVYQAYVHEKHDELVRFQTMERRRCGADQSKTRVPSNTHCYALKTFKRRPNDESTYSNELEAFRQITEAGTRVTPGMIEFYGSFEYRNSFNIILEYADEGTLEDYFHKVPKPKTGAEALDFWEKLFETIKAVYRIHEHHLKPQDTGHDGLILQGWHQDLKPENILVLNTDESAYRWSFKIADLGLAHFKTIMAGHPEALDFDRRGGRIYEAPECSSRSKFLERDRNMVRRSIDIWSLGAVFSESAVWAVRGSDGLAEYRSQRKKETDIIPNFTHGNCFHNGTRRLDAVENQHRALKDGLCQSDFITGKVLDQMVDEMLFKDADTRPTAKTLQIKAETLIKNAKLELDRERTKYWTTPESSPPQGSHLRQNSASPEQRIDSGDTGSQGVIFGKERLVRSPAGTLTLDPSRIMHSTGSPPARNKQPISGESSAYMLSPTRHSVPPMMLPSGSQVEYSYVEAFQGKSGDRPRGLGTLQSKLSQVEEYCSVAQAREWYSKRKAGQKDAVLPGNGLEWMLVDRDYVFMIDDSNSMRAYWDEMTKLVELLTYITKRKDQDALELYFLSSNKVQKIKSATAMGRQVSRHEAIWSTNLDSALESDLHKYGKKIEPSKHPLTFFHRTPPKRSIYVFTDGILTSGDENQGHECIRSLVKKLAAASLTRGQIGIQFIRFGQSEEGIRRLDILDRLKDLLDLELDIVDTEPSNGNVWKMLVGAINNKFDRDGEEDSNPHATSS